VVALRQDYVQARPEAAAIFDFLERHWPRLANSIEASLIPTTNNTVERVIGRFDQHYQNFCGFESIADAQRYLAVFEKVYRFTPFSQDAQPTIRGKCPLQSPGHLIWPGDNWRATTSASCPWRPSAPASALSGRYRPRRPHMSPARDALQFARYQRGLTVV